MNKLKITIFKKCKYYDIDVIIIIKINNLNNYINKMTIRILIKYIIYDKCE